MPLDIKSLHALQDYSVALLRVVPGIQGVGSPLRSNTPVRSRRLSRVDIPLTRERSRFTPDPSKARP